MSAEVTLFGRVPDLIAPVIGYRQWRLVGGELRSPYSNDPWATAMVSARCRAGGHPNEPAPVNGCSCGVYAWYRPCPRTASAGSRECISGAVLMWGQIELHYAGMRGRHCRVMALELPLSRWRKRDRVLAAAERLGVPAIPRGELTAVAAEHGAPVPQQLIPARPVRADGPTGVVPARILPPATRGQRAGDIGSRRRNVSADAGPRGGAAFL